MVKPGPDGEGDGNPGEGPISPEPQPQPRPGPVFLDKAPPATEGSEGTKVVDKISETFNRLFGREPKKPKKPKKPDKS